VNAIWHEDGRSAALLNQAGGYQGRVYIGHWFEPGSREPLVAWLADSLTEGEMRPVFVAEALALPAEGERRELEEAARHAIAAGPPELDEPRLPPKEFIDELDLLLMAWGDAHERLRAASKRTEEFVHELIYVALTETLSWVCTIDQVLRATWAGFSPAFREQVSSEIDDAILAVTRANKARADDRGVAYSEPPASIFIAHKQRQQTNEPYGYWSQALALKQQDLDPRFLSGLHWMRGKLFHRGVLHAVDLRQWRPGAEPRWKWLPSSLITQSGQAQDRQRQADYDAVVAGKDVLGSLELGGVLLDTVWLFTRLYHEHAAFSGT
jgi:hypothetical protein